MKGILKLAGIFVSLAALAAVLLFALSVRSPQSTPKSGPQALQERLVQLGVPVKSLVVTQESPLQLTITLEEDHKQDRPDSNSVWYTTLTEREVELAHLRLGMWVSSYRLIIVSPQGDVLSDSEAFLYPGDRSQNLTPGPPSAVQDSQAKEIFENNFDFQGLKLLSLEVPAGYTDSDNHKAVAMDLSTGKEAGDTDMAPINQLILSLRPQIEKINDRYGTGFVLVHVKIISTANQLLVDYVEDLELWRQGFWLADGLHGGWYPEPAVSGTGEPPSPTPAPLPSLIPSATGPRPTATPSGAYPTLP